MEAPTFNLQSVNECNPRCTFACCFALVQAGPMEYFHHLPYLLYFSLQEILSFVHCAAGNTRNILAVCSGMGFVGSWTLWSLWVSYKLRHSVVYGNKWCWCRVRLCLLGNVWNGSSPRLFYCASLQVLLLLQDGVSGWISGFLMQFSAGLFRHWCHSVPSSLHQSCSCSTSWTTADDSFLFGGRVDNQGLAEEPLSSLKLHPQGKYWLCLRLVLSSPPAKYSFTLALHPAG